MERLTANWVTGVMKPVNLPITILLIEDESLIRMGTAAMLEDAGYRVVEAGDADEGLDALASDPLIRIVVTDVQMPGKLTGLDLCGIIGHKYPEILTLVTSGRASLTEARECGARRFLPKPYSAATIQSAIGSMLGGLVLA